MDFIQFVPARKTTANALETRITLESDEKGADLASVYASLPQEKRRKRPLDSNKVESKSVESRSVDSKNADSKSADSNSVERQEKRVKTSHSLESSRSTLVDSGWTLYCSICQETVPSSSTLDETQLRQQHASSLSHQLAKNDMEKQLGQDTLKPVFFHIQPDNVGYQLLEKSGWTAGTGLGPDESGRTAPISTRLKNDKLGLGHKDSRKRVTHTIADVERQYQQVGVFIYSYSQSMASVSHFIPKKQQIQQQEKQDRKHRAILNYLKE